jgi:hypothetical protein
LRKKIRGNLNNGSAAAAYFYLFILIVCLYTISPFL